MTTISPLSERPPQGCHVHPEQFGHPGAGFFPGFNKRTGAGKLMRRELAGTAYSLAPPLGVERAVVSPAAI